MPTNQPKREPSADKHASSKRVVVPTSEMSEIDNSLNAKEKRNLDPKGKEGAKLRKENGFHLNWDRAGDLDELPSWVKTIFIHEKILPQALINSVSRNASEGENQGKLFDANFNGIDAEKRWLFWEHEANWSNRLIHGNSIEVMTSLLEREKREGQVQCLFFDPPFGIDFKGLVANKGGGGDSRNDGEGARAFADQYIRKNKDGTTTKGIAPFFDGIYRHLRLARRLLAESGSIFLQISEVNVNRISLLMDEVFGNENRVAMISYSTGRKHKSMLGSSGDYLLWYAKNKDAASSKYRQLYEPQSKQEYFERAGGNAVVVHRKNFEMKLASQIGEIDDSNWRFGRKYMLFSQHIGVKFQSKSWPTNEAKSKFSKSGKGKWKPSGGLHWMVNNPAGLDKLTEKNRLCCSMDRGIANVKHVFDKGLIDSVPQRSQLQWIAYFDEYPGKKIDDVWMGGIVKDKWFTVQTPERIIERCILMSTDPGDLVLDPTCGSGTSAVVAEKLGRRWITSDAGAWQIALCRERLVTRTFDEFLLRGTEDGQEKDKELDKIHQTSLTEEVPEIRKFDDRDPKQGFVYERRAYVTAGNLANDVALPSIPLVDRPIVAPGGKDRRVASAFTVERLSPYDIQNTEQVLQGTRDETLARRVIETLNGKKLSGNKLRNIVAIDEKSLEYLTHEGKFAGKKVAIWLAEDDLTVGSFHLNAAIKEAAGRDYKQLVVVAFGYADENISAHYKKGPVDVWLLLAPRALSIEDTDAKNTGAPVLLAEPEIKVNMEGDKKISITVQGYSTWDPLRKENSVICLAEDYINCILIDTDYDNESFFARLLQFPNSAKPNKDTKHIKSYREQLGDVMDEKLWKNITSTTSVPFDIPKANGVAVRITTVSGDMMSSVISREEILQQISDEEDQVSGMADSGKKKS